MKLRHHARAGLALAAAYAVALQGILLAFSAPIAGAGGVVTLQICSGIAGHSAPAGHGQDCLDACLTGCCGGAPICPSPPGAMLYAPAPGETMAPVFDVRPVLVVRVTNAHRSRAPPAA
jgi:hypothetical protein